MNAILNLLLLVGLFPGAILPSRLTDQLLAPVQSKTDELPTSPVGPAHPEDGTNSDESHDFLTVQSTYYATRPASLQLTRGEMRTINTQLPCWIGTRDLADNPDWNLRLTVWPGRQFMAPDFCHAHEPTRTFPQLIPHAPPLNY